MILWHGVLRSPFHGMLSSGMMLITLTGRKTGKKYTTPVGYYHEEGCLWVITSRERIWWRNLVGGSRVSLFLKRKLVQGEAEVELDEGFVTLRIVEYLHHVPQAAKQMGIRIVNNVPDKEDIVRTAKDRLFIRIKLLD